MTDEPDTPAERVRERMKHWLETTGLSQDEFVADLQKSQVWLQKVLKGENHVRLKDLDAVADAMRTTASELVRGTSERYQLELTPTEVRIVEKLRRRPTAFNAVAELLQIPAAERPLHAPAVIRAAIKRKKKP